MVVNNYSLYHRDGRWSERQDEHGEATYVGPPHGWQRMLRPDLVDGFLQVTKNNFYEAGRMANMGRNGSSHYFFMEGAGGIYQELPVGKLSVDHEYKIVFWVRSEAQGRSPLHPIFIAINEQVVYRASPPDRWTVQTTDTFRPEPFKPTVISIWRENQDHYTSHLILNNRAAASRE